jgi:glycosyltransferase involved in cell wall biosynthesis
MRKKKLLFHSNFHNAFTGFGKNCKNVLSYLFKTGKYEIVEFATGVKEDSGESLTTPWKVIGAIPADQEVINQWNGDPQKQRALGYGAALIDQVIQSEKPDVYIGAEDIWAFNKYTDKPWWNKTTCAIWTTLDSLPILKDAVENAPKIQNYFVWASFAEKELHRLGFNHVKTLRGSIETKDFFPLGDNNKRNLRNRFSINDEDLVIGFVFRNQLRKSVPNLLDGFKMFIDSNPSLKPKLLLHTNWSEGWNIPSLIKEKGIDPSAILTTYICPKCGEYEVKSFSGQNLDCKFCKSKKSQITTNVKNGISEKQLNEVYNLMNVYCHPFTSGGQEIPVQEAKLTELVTLVTNYSCGEDLCTEESGGLPLEWSEYREPGTQFIKATTNPKSIFNQLKYFCSFSDKEKKDMGVRARDWTLANFSKEIIGSKVESFIDNSPFCDFDFDIKFVDRNPSYNPPSINNNTEWLLNIYNNILRMSVTPEDSGLQGWLKSLESGMDRNQILSFFKDTARKENEAYYRKGDLGISNLIDDNKLKRLVIVMPKSIGDVFLTTSLLPSISKTYPDYAIYFCTEPVHFPILDGNPYVHKCIEYHPKFDDLLFLEGSGDNPGFFDIAFLPHIGTQKIFNYQHNGEDKIQFDLCT